MTEPHTANDLEALLAVQGHDLTLDRARRERATIPSRMELTAAGEAVARQSTVVADVRTRRDAVLSEEKRLDDEASSLRARAMDVDEKLYSGSVTSPRELQALQADVESLRRHMGALEDDELERMEEREALDAELAAAEDALGDLAAEVKRLQAAVAAAEAEIDGRIAEEATTRARAAEAVPPSLLADYERRRSVNRGTGAARLSGSTCGGCRLTIPATEVDRIRHDPAGQVWYCDNCGAILVPA